MNESTIKPQVSRYFKLERNTVIYSRHLGGESFSKLSRAYDMNEKTIRVICSRMKKHIDRGVISPVKAYEE